MMMDLEQLIKKYDMNITGVLHLGANLGQEAKVYDDNGIKNVWWVEGNPDVINKLITAIKPYNHTAIQALVYDQDNVQVMFHVTNIDGLSSSILEFGTHKQFSPDMIFEKHIPLFTSTVDSLIKWYNITNVNFLSMDLQGAELFALRGATELLKSIDYIFTEINTDEVYNGCAKVWEIEEFLPDFKRVETLMVGKQGWGGSL